MTALDLTTPLGATLALLPECVLSGWTLVVLLYIACGATGDLMLSYGMKARVPAMPWLIAGTAVLALGYALPAFYRTYSLFKGAQAPANPWGAKGLEWTVPSPPPTFNFDEDPVVNEPAYN